MFELVLGGRKKTAHNSIDEAMIACFKWYPRSHFSDWQETAKLTWLNVFNNNKLVGKIFEVT